MPKGWKLGRSGRSGVRLHNFISIVIPKESTFWLRNSSDPIGFSLKVTELLAWYTFSIYLI